MIEVPLYMTCHRPNHGGSLDAICLRFRVGDRQPREGDRQHTIIDSLKDHHHSESFMTERSCSGLGQ